MAYKYNNKSSQSNEWFTWPLFIRPSRDSSIYLFVFHLLFKAPNILPSRSWSLAHVRSSSCTTLLTLKGFTLFSNSSYSFALCRWRWSRIYIYRTRLLISDTEESHLNQIVTLSAIKLRAINHCRTPCCFCRFSLNDFHQLLYVYFQTHVDGWM